MFRNLNFFDYNWTFAYTELLPFDYGVCKSNNKESFKSSNPKHFHVYMTKKSNAKNEHTTAVIRSSWMNKFHFFYKGQC